MDHRYLLIDFDGVFHPEDQHFAVEDIKVPPAILRAAGMFVHVDLLAKLLTPHPDVRLVVHSSWRKTHGDTELRELLGPLGGRFIGATDRALDRQLSIFDFVVRRRIDSHRYRVLDDQVEMLQELGDVVIPCDPISGIAAPSTLLQLKTWLDD
ncbi:HAD domain-containing protein [Paucibacter soli]|uniref:HAD domain-containing protein n=1 Tax=Paucibacter soli TaxID=3133433 RepID=UPI0030B03506